jgi:hypothetical protein
MSTTPTQTAVIASVNASATSVPVLAASGARRGATVFNEGSTVLYLAFAATASVTAYTVQVAVNGYYELPTNLYGGVISGIWAGSPTGAARVTSW